MCQAYLAEMRVRVPSDHLAAGRSQARVVAVDGLPHGRAIDDRMPVVVGSSPTLSPFTITITFNP